MVLCYRETNDSLPQAQALYEARFGRRPSTRVPGHSRGTDTGRLRVFNPPEHHYGRPRFDPDFEEMDPERQPLLAQGGEIRSRRHRPLTYEEVLDSRTETRWRRARFCMVLMFWAIMAMFLSMVAAILIQAKCGDIDGIGPAVPPVHMTLAPLIASARALNAGRDNVWDDSVETTAYIL